MKICPNCNMRNSNENVKFCTKCGTELAMAQKSDIPIINKSLFGDINWIARTGALTAVLFLLQLFISNSAITLIYFFFFFAGMNLFGFESTAAAGVLSTLLRILLRIVQMVFRALFSNGSIWILSHIFDRWLIGIVVLLAAYYFTNKMKWFSSLGAFEPYVNIAACVFALCIPMYLRDTLFTVYYSGIRSVFSGFLSTVGSFLTLFVLGCVGGLLAVLIVPEVKKAIGTNNNAAKFLGLK